MAKLGAKVTETKEAVKAVAAPVEAKVIKDTVKKAEEVKSVAKTSAKKTEEVKKVAKTAAKKTVAKASAKTSVVKPQVIVQYQCNEVEISALEERVKTQFISEGHKAATIKKVNIYVKPEEYAAYYVINDKFSGRVDLF